MEIKWCTSNCGVPGEVVRESSRERRDWKAEGQES